MLQTKNIRFWVLVFTSTLLATEYIYVTCTYIGSLQIIRLSQFFALTAVTYLYTALLISPLTQAINLPFKPLLVKARRGIGVSAFIFACAHAANAFFRQLGGFPGLTFLNTRFLQGVELGFVALLILTLLASTSFDIIVRKLSFKRWKLIHRLIYIGATLVVIHALMLGSHFADLSRFIPRLFHAALAALLLLEALRLDKYLAPRFANLKIGPVFSIVLCIVIFSGFAYPNLKLGIHQYSSHSQAEMPVAIHEPQNMYMPGMVGDKTKKYNLDWTTHGKTFDFKIYDASNGDQVTFLATPYEKPFHLIVVDEELRYFGHLHPIQTIPGTYSISLSFPKPGFYRFYADYQPLGSVEQQSAFSYYVSQSSLGTPSVSVPEPGTYTANISQTATSIKVSVMNNNQTVTDLHPYLNTFGHMVLIRKQTHDYVHLHPVLSSPPALDSISGPDMEFVTSSLTGNLPSGDYQGFMQIKPSGNLVTLPFEVSIQ